MKRITATLITTFMMTASCFATVDSTKQIVNGINWHPASQAITDTFASGLNFNAWHTPIYEPGSDTYGNDTTWFKNAPGTPMVLYNNISKYADAERMVYSPLVKPAPGDGDAKDTLRNFYFFDRALTYLFADPFTGARYTACDSSGNHGDSTILWHNEFPGAWRNRQFHIRSLERPLKLVVKMQVSSMPPSGHGGDVVLSVVLKTGSTTVHTYDIPWSSFDSANVDRVRFSDWISDTVLFGQNFDTLTANGLNLEVHSRRYVTTRIAWVAVEDTFAHDFLAGKDLDPSDAALVAKRQHVDSMIVLDASKLASIRGSKPYRIYLNDEPFCANYASHHRVDSLVGHIGLTEIGLPCTRRYIEQVRPEILWSGALIPGGQICASLDSAFWNHNPPPLDSINQKGDSVFKDTTFRNRCMRTITPQWGYFPDGVSNQTMAMSTAHTEWAFDPFDYRQGGNIQQVNEWWQRAKLIDSCVYFAPDGQYAPKEWWGHLFEYAHLHIGTLDSSGHAVRRGYYNPSAPAVHEQVTMLANFQLAMGARGIWTYRGTTAPCDEDVACIGVADESGIHDSNWGLHHVEISGGDTINDDFNLPTMYARRSEGARNYGAFLRDHASELVDKKWQGAFIRYSTEYWSGGAYQHMIGVNDSIGTAPPINFSADSVSRPILSQWVSTDDSIAGHVTQVALPDSLRWVLYGLFSGVTGMDTMYVYAENLAADPRSLRCTFTDGGVPATMTRGARTIHTRLALDPNKTYHVTMLDGEPYDTLLSGNATIVQTYPAGGAKIFRIVKECNLNTVTTIDDEGDALNNGVHLRKLNLDGSYRFVYVRHDSVFVRDFDGCGVMDEKLICKGGADTIISHPGGGSDTLAFTAVNHNPSIAHHRGMADEDLIVWQRSRVGTGVAPEQEILGCAIDMAGNPQMMFDSLLSGKFINMGYDPTAFTSYTASSVTYLATPVVVGNDSGWVVEWSDSSAHIRVAAVGGQMGQYRRSRNTLALTAPTAVIPAKFPSVAWGTDRVASSVRFYPQVHSAWQQDSGGVSHIWHQVYEVHYDTSGNLIVQVVSNEDPERVSKTGNTICENSMPCITVSAAGSSTVSLPNLSSIMWQATVVNDTVNFGRVFYRERINRNTYGPFISYSSSKRTFRQPSVFVSPSDTFRTSLLMCWYSDHNSMHMYLPGETILHGYPFAGVHSTLSFSDNIPDPFMYLPPSDPFAATLYQTPTSAFRGGLAKFDAVVNSNVSLARSGTIHSVSVQPRTPGVQSFPPCNGHLGGIQVSIRNTYPLDTVFAALKPISPTSTMPGNGINENNAVKSKMMALHMGTPLAIERAITAQDTEVLADLIIGGRTVRAYVELIDSATGVVLSVIDSFIVSARGDTVDRRGTIMYDPDVDEVDFPVFVRARIAADSLVARWSVEALTKFESEEESEPDGFAKVTVKNIGRGGWAAMLPNPIALMVYPNPFSARTRIVYSVPLDDAGETGEVVVYAMNGTARREVFRGSATAGRHALEFNAQDLPSGQYICAVRLKNHMDAKMIVLTK